MHIMYVFFHCEIYLLGLIVGFGRANMSYHLYCLQKFHSLCLLFLQTILEHIPLFQLGWGMDIVYEGCMFKHGRIISPPHPPRCLQSFKNVKQKLSPTHPLHPLSGKTSQMLKLHPLFLETCPIPGASPWCFTVLPTCHHPSRSCSL